MYKKFLWTSLTLTSLWGTNSAIGMEPPDELRRTRRVHANETTKLHPPQYIEPSFFESVKVIKPNPYFFNVIPDAPQNKDPKHRQRIRNRIDLKNKDLGYIPRGNPYSGAWGQVWDWETYWNIEDLDEEIIDLCSFSYKKSAPELVSFESESSKVISREYARKIMKHENSEWDKIYREESSNLDKYRI